jgi:hypothetical protein
LRPQCSLILRESKYPPSDRRSTQWVVSNQTCHSPTSITHITTLSGLIFTSRPPDSRPGHRIHVLATRDPIPATVFTSRWSYSPPSHQIHPSELWCVSNHRDTRTELFIARLLFPSPTPCRSTSDMFQIKTGRQYSFLGTSNHHFLMLQIILKLRMTFATLNCSSKCRIFHYSMFSSFHDA